MQKEQIVKNIVVVFDAAYRSNLLEMEEIPAVIETKQNIFGLMQSHDQQATLLEEKDKKIAELEKEIESLKRTDAPKGDLDTSERAMKMDVVTDTDDAGSEEDEDEGEEDDEEQATEQETDKVANSDVTASETAKPSSSAKIDKIKSIKKVKR